MARVANPAAEYVAVIGSDMTGFERGMLSVHGEMDKLGARLSRVGSDLTRYVSLPLAAVAGIAVKTFADFDAAMVQSTAIMGKLSDEMRNSLEVGAREVAKTTTFAAREAAEGYFFLASAGLDAASSLKALPQVSRFAQAGMFDLAKATDLLTDAQSALGLTVRDDAVKNLENMTRVSDALVKANVLANASVEQFSAALTNRAAASARILGKDIEETLGVLAAFADQGTKAEKAGEALSIVWRDLQRAALKNADAFKHFNVAVFDSSGEMRNTADIIGDIEHALSGMSDAQKRATLSTLGFQDKSIANLLTLIGTSDAIRRYEGELRNAAGTTDEIANKQLQSFSAQLTLAKNRLIDVAISIGEKLAPHIKTATDLVVRFAEGFANLPDGMQAAIIAAGVVVAAIGPLLAIGGQLISSFGAIKAAVASVSAVLSTSGLSFSALLGPIGLVVAAVAGFAIAYAKDWGGVRQLTADIVSELKQLYNSIADATSGLGKIISFNLGIVGDIIKTNLQEALNGIRIVLKLINGDWSEAWSIVVETVKNRINLVLGIIQKFADAAPQVWEYIKNAFVEGVNFAWNYVVNGFQTGIETAGSILAKLPEITKTIVEQLPPLFAYGLGLVTGQMAKWAVDLTNLMIQAGLDLAKAAYAWITDIASQIYQGFRNWLGIGQDGTKGFIDAVANILVNLPVIFVKAIVGVTQFLATLPSKLWEWGKDIASSFLSGLQSGFSGGGTAALNTLSEKIKGSLSGIAESVKSSVSGAMSGLTEGIKAGTPGATGAAGALGKGAGKAMGKGLKDETLSQINEWLSATKAGFQLSEAAYKALDETTRKALKAQRDAWKETQTAAEVALAGIALEASKQRQITKAVFDAMPKDVQVALTKMGVVVKEGVQLIKGQFESLDSAAFKLSSGFGKAFDQITKDLARNLTIISESLSPGKFGTVQFAEVEQAYRKMVEGINQATQLHIAGDTSAGILKMRDAITELVDFWAKKGREWGLSTATISKQIRADLDRLIENLPEEYKKAAREMADALIGGLEHAEQQSKPKIKSIAELYDELKDRIGAGMAAIAKSIGDAFGASQQRVNDTTDGILDIINGLPGRIGDKLRQVTGTVFEWVNGIDRILKGLHKIWDEIPNGLEGLIPQLKPIFNKILGSFNDFGAQLLKNIKGLFTSVGGLLNTGLGVGGIIGGIQLGGIGGSALTGAGIGLIAGSFIPVIGNLVGAAIGAGVGALVGGIKRLFSGGKSEAQKAAEEGTKLQLEAARAGVVKALEESKQAMLGTAQQFAQLAEQLLFYTKIPKETIRLFIRDMGRLFRFMADELDRMTPEMLDDIKRSSEALKPGAELLAAMPLVFDGINRHIGAADGQIELYFRDFDKLIDRLGESAERSPDKLEKQIKKFSLRLTPSAELLINITQFLKDMFDLKRPPVENFDIIDDALEEITDRVGALAQKTDKRFAKELEFFAQKVAAGVAFWNEGVGVVKEMFEIPRPTEADFDNLFESLDTGLNRSIALAAKHTGEAFDHSVLFWERAKLLWEAVRGGIDITTAIASIEQATKEMWDTWVGNIDLMVQALMQAVGLAETGVELSLEFQDATAAIRSNIQTGSDNLAEAVAAANQALAQLSDIGEQANITLPGGAGGNVVPFPAPPPPPVPIPQTGGNSTHFNVTVRNININGQPAPQEIRATVHAAIREVVEQLEQERNAGPGRRRRIA